MSKQIPAPAAEQLAKDGLKVAEHLGSVSAGAETFTPLEGLAVGTRVLVVFKYRGTDLTFVYCLKITATNEEEADDGCWLWRSTRESAPSREKKCAATTTYVGFEDFGDGTPVSLADFVAGVGTVPREAIHFYRLRASIDLRVERLAAIPPAERTRLNDMYGSVQQIERTPFVLSKHQGEREGKEGLLLELKDELELQVDTIAGLQELVGNTQALETVRPRSSLVTLHLSFLEAFDDPAEVTNLLQSLGPHMMHLKAVCITAAHCAVIVKVMESCPKEHLRVVSLLGTKSLGRSAMREFMKMKKTEVELLHFSEMPSEGLSVVSGVSRRFPDLDVEDYSDGAVPEVLFPPKWPVKEAVPVAELPEGQWAFITALPTLGVIEPESSGPFFHQTQCTQRKSGSRCSPSLIR